MRQSKPGWGAGHGVSQIMPEQSGKPAFHGFEGDFRLSSMRGDGLTTFEEMLASPIANTWYSVEWQRFSLARRVAELARAACQWALA